MSKPSTIKSEDIAARIFSVRGLRVLLDSELAAMYGVATMRFNEAVRRNEARFPADFSFHLTEQEVRDLISQSAISSLKRGSHGGRRKPPRVFTEHGAIMAAMVLNSPRAVQMSVYVADTRKQFDQVYEAILSLMQPAPRRN